MSYTYDPFWQQRISDKGMSVIQYFPDVFRVDIIFE